MNIFEIPMSSDNPWQNFTVPLDDDVFEITQKWNATAQKWFIDLDGVTTDVSVKGICLITGIDLLAPYGLRQLGRLYVIDTQNKRQDPTFSSLGDQHVLVYVGKED